MRSVSKWSLLAAEGHLVELLTKLEHWKRAYPDDRAEIGLLERKIKEARALLTSTDRSLAFQQLRAEMLEERAGRRIEGGPLT